MIHYSISYKHPSTNTLTIELTVTPVTSSPIRLFLPTWRPGRYELADYAQNIYAVKAYQQEKEITVEVIGKSEWSISTYDVSSSIKVTYDYYAHKMDAGNSWLDEEQMYINFINCCLEVDGYTNLIHEVELKIPADYQVATSLEKKGNCLKATNYLELIDSPVICSNRLLHHSFEEGDTLFHVWIQGNCTPDWRRIETDFRKYTKEQIDLFGAFPCKEYHYLFQLLPYKHYHGVEHQKSTVITLGPASELQSDELYNNLLGISSHELFHTWNVTRIRPTELAPYSFKKEISFETGYIAEGLTTYYGDYLLGRSGVFNTKQYFDEIDTLFKRHFENYGRFNLSLTDSSKQLWLDGYKLGIPNRKVSIYVKGAICALVLDLEIRQLTNHQKSLDDVMRLLWTKFPNDANGYSTADYQSCIEEVTGNSFTSYFDECIFGTESIEERLRASLLFIGCDLKCVKNKDNWMACYGFQKTSTNKVIRIAPDSPAFFSLSIDDEIIEHDEVEKRLVLKVKRAGLEKTIILNQDLTTYFDNFIIEKIGDATDNQKRNFEQWLKKKF